MISINALGTRALGTRELGLISGGLSSKPCWNCFLVDSSLRWLQVVFFFSVTLPFLNALIHNLTSAQ